MAAYIDASWLLAGVLGDVELGSFEEQWRSESVRVASLLTRAECTVVVRRAAAAVGKAPDGAWVRARGKALQPLLDQLVYKAVDAEITARLEADERLAQCRTLDALHAATALYFQPHLDDELRVFTRDDRLAALARRLGLRVG